MDATRKPYQKAFVGFAITDADKHLLATMTREHQEVLAATGSYDAMAAALNIPLGTLRSRLNRARTALVALRAMQREAA